MRRTPALTKQARELFEEAVGAHGWTPGLTINVIARATGLSLEQVRDAIFNEAADEWRRAWTRRLEGSNNASS